MRRLGVFFLFALACGGIVDDPNEDPVAIVNRGGPLGVCESRVEYGSDPNDETKNTARFGYDSTGHITRYLETFRGSAVQRSIWRTYDEDRILTQEENLPGIGPPRRHARWEYDDRKRTRKVTFALDGDHTYETTLDYDDQDRRIGHERRTDGVVSDRVTITYLSGSPDVVEEAHDLGGDGTIDWTWRLGFQGDWLVFLESVRGGKVDVREDYTYSDLARGELSERRMSGDTLGTSVDTFTWVDHRMVRSTHDVSDFPPGSYPQSVDWQYDGAGHPVVRTWKTPQYEFRTTIDWSGNQPTRVARRDAKTSQIIERWSFDYGCSEERSVIVLLAPIADWQRETTAIPFELRRSKMWSSFDVM